MLKPFLSNPKLRYENNPTTLILQNKSQLHVSLSYDDDEQEEEKEGLRTKKQQFP